MVEAIVYAFAIADGLEPVVGAAPYDVLSRQLPRLLVVRLNDDGDRGARFFPLLGTAGGKRGFLRLTTPFDPAQLIALHKQQDVRFVCDGWLRAGELTFRCLDGGTGKVLRELTLPFDPRTPTAVLARLQFELMDLLGWSGRPTPELPFDGELLGWFLILKDTVLRLEAGLDADVEHAVRAAERCFELDGGNLEIVDVVTDVAAHVLKQREHRDSIAAMLRPLVDSNELPADRFERLGALLLAAGDERSAATATLRAARSAIEREELVERCVGLLFRLERYEEAAELVELARQRGSASVTALAQYAACCDRLGRAELRTELCDEMLAVHDLPVTVARLLVSFLLEDDRAERARAVAERALAVDPTQSLMHLELGRACLDLDDSEHAAAALTQALERGLPPEHEHRARRLLRLASQPGLWRDAQNVETALAEDDLDRAFRSAVQLAKNWRHFAEAWFLVGLVRHKRGEDHRAECALRRAIRLDDALPDAHNRLGILLVGKGRVEPGLEHLERAHALAPTEPSPMLHLAQGLAAAGRHDEARRFIDLAAQNGAEPGLIAAVRREIEPTRR